MKALGRFLALPGPERTALAEAVLALLAARLAFGLLPFPQALRLFRVDLGEAGTGRVAADEARLVGRAIARAAGRVPFRAVCLQQAFAAVVMLRRRGLSATVHFGVSRNGDALQAHAWSRCGDTTVTGGAAAPAHTPLAAFTA